jgi:hypothetical protein
MPITLSIVSGIVLTIFLWRLWKNTHASEMGLPFDVDMSVETMPPCTGELVAALFSPQDLEFVSQFNSGPLKELFLKERKAVALAWVRSTASAVHQIMQEHARISRSSQDLEIGTETGIYARYVALQAACAFLLLSIGLAGPVHLRHLSLYVYRLSERLGDAHSALKAATETKEFQDAWHR